MNSIKNDIADPISYRIYWSIMMNDILHKLDFDATKENKMILHEFHKRILGYKTIAGKPQELVSGFLLNVIVFWESEFGFFIRTSRKQYLGMEDKSLKETWNLL